MNLSVYEYCYLHQSHISWADYGEWLFRFAQISPFAFHTFPDCAVFVMFLVPRPLNRRGKIGCPAKARQLHAFALSYDGSNDA